MENKIISLNNLTKYHEKLVKILPVQSTEVTEASEDLEGRIIQYVGSEEDTYKRGHFYECVKGEDDTYSWEELEISGEPETDKIDFSTWDD